MGVLARIAISDLDAQDEKELEDAIAKLYDKRPEWLRSLREFSRTETRQHLRQRGLSLSQFKASQPYVVQFPDELMNVPARYALKLGKALYYKHTGRILEPDANIRVTAVPNSEFMADYFPRASFNILNQIPALSRSGKSLADQFGYRFALTTDCHGAGFVVQFRESIVMLILVKEYVKVRHATDEA